MLGNYSPKELIHEGYGYQIHRGRGPDGRDVLIKRASGARPRPEQLGALRREFELSQELGLAHGLTPLEWLAQPGAIVFDGHDVSALTLPDEPPKHALEIAIGLAQALAELHQAGLVHQALRPGNVFWYAAQQRILLAGLGRPTPDKEKQEEILPPGDDEYPYLAPEQTGRLDQPIDERTDLYALGTLYYALFTGKPAFSGDDRAALVHAHLARAPTPPQQHNAALSPALSKLILKLLAKTPGARYPSSAALLADLRQIQESDQGRTLGEDWEAGRHDPQQRLRLAERLHGRERELAELSAALSAPSCHWILVSGVAGIGKSSLIAAFQRTPEARGAVFLKGKFQQLHRHVPYSALIEAIAGWVRMRLTENEDAVASWRELLRRKLSNELPALIDVIPELRLLVGNYPAAPPLSPTDTRNRLHIAFRALLTTVAGQQALIVFLDDLHWADPASMQLLRGLGEAPRALDLTVLGTYRDNELSPLHPLALTLETLQKREGALKHIALKPLTPVALDRMLAQILGRDEAAVRPLSQWLGQQTHRNPFFVQQILETLYRRGLLSSEDGRHWHWDLDSVRELGLPDDVIDFLSANFRAMPRATQSLLAAAASIGRSFRTSLLSKLCDRDGAAIRAELKQAERAQLLFPERSEDGRADPDAWHFAHDRIHQAAYALSPPQKRSTLHLRIARLLLQQHPQPAQERYLLYIVNQFNLAAEAITDTAERVSISELNLRAAIRAKAAAAFAAAAHYGAAGMQLLSGDHWGDHYALTLELMLERAECEYLCGHFSLAESLFDEALRHARGRQDTARALAVKITLATNDSRPLEALELGRRCLALFDIKLPLEPAALKKEVRRASREATELLEHPVSEDKAQLETPGPEQALVTDVLTRLYPPAYQHSIESLVLVTMQLVINAIRNPHLPGAAFAFINYACVLGSFLNDYPRGQRFARIALDLAESSNDASLKCRIHYIYGSMVSHWTQPAREGNRHLQAAYEEALSANELVFGGLSIAFLFRGRLLQGERLDDILEDWSNYAEGVARLRYQLIETTFTLSRQWMLALKGKTLSPTSFSDDHFDEAQARAIVDASSAKSPAHWFYLLKAALYYHNGEIAQALDMIATADRYLDAAFGQLAAAEHQLLRGLIYAAAMPSANKRQRRRYRQGLDDAQRLLSSWSEHCPANFAHKKALLAAEIARLDDDDRNAAEYYRQAAEIAAAEGYLQYQALAHELAAGFYRERGFTAMGQAHLSESHYAYVRWGASAKAEALARNHPETITAATQRAGENEAAQALDPVDVGTITRTALTLSSEIRLDRLLAELLRNAMENAGATKALLLLERDKELVIEGRAQAEAGVEVLQGRPVQGSGECIEAIVNYARRTQETVVIADSSDHPLLGEASAAQGLSLLCLPIIRQGHILGLLYLENELATHAFTEHRLALLSLLTAQAATALENALLYDSLGQEVLERKQAEDTAREGERRWRSLLEGAQLAVVSLDLDGRIDYVNPYLLRLSGREASELIGHNWFRTLLPRRYAPQDAQQRFYKLLADGQTSLRSPVLTAGGEARHIAWSTTWLHDTHGKPSGTVSIGEDITDRLMAERALRRLNRTLEQRVTHRTAELEAANKELAAFAYSVSHDLRAPLRSIDGFSQALLEDYGESLGDTGMDYLDRVRRASKRMGSLIDAILQLSRMTRSTLTREAVDLSALAAEVLEELQESAPERRVETDIQPRLRVRGDPRLLRILLDNLIGNAWKYTRQTADARISLSREGRGQHAVFCVSDNGSGFDMAYADRLFVAFQRLHDQDTFEGIGIGLATVQRIVHRHGGRIWAQAAPGEGARFYFTLSESESQ